MIYLVDTDVAITLCECDLIHHLPAALDCSWESIKFDTELRRLAKAIQKGGRYVGLSSDGLRRLTRFVHSKDCRYINDSDVSQEDYLQATAAGANDGEAELCAAIQAFYPTEVIIVTGDRSALGDLYHNLEWCDMIERMMGRVLCLEQVLERLRRHVGHPQIAAGLLTGRNRLSCIKAYFRAANQDDATLTKAIDARIVSQRGATPNLLAP